MPRSTPPGVGALLVCILLLASGCASGGGSTGSDSSTLTREEIAAVQVGNLYEAVQRLRPRWLLVRGNRSLGLESIVGVYQGQTFLGDTEALRRFGVDAVARLRYVDGATASATFPRMSGRHLEAAIVLETRQ